MEIIIYNEGFSSNLRYLRRKKKISQKKMAETLGFSVYHLRNIELFRCEAVFTHQQLKQLCALLDASVETVLNCEGLDK